VLWEEQVGEGFSLPTFSPDRRWISAPFQENRDHDAVAIFNVATQDRFDVELPFHVLFRAAWTDDGAALIVNRRNNVSHIVVFDRFWERDGR
jgi:hypothetical protein